MNFSGRRNAERLDVYSLNMVMRFLNAAIVALFFIHQQNVAGAEPNKAELTKAIKEHVDAVAKKSSDHKFHATMSSLVRNSTVEIRHPPVSPVGSWRLIPKEFRNSFPDGFDLSDLNGTRRLTLSFVR